MTTPADQEVADIIRREDRRGALGATVVDVAIPSYATVSNTSVIAYEFKESLAAYLAATPAAPFKTLQEIVNSGLYRPSLQTVLTNALALDTTMQAYRDRLAGREVFRQALVDAMDSNELDGLIYPTIRQKPILVPATNQAGSNCRVSAQSGLPAISVPAGFTADGIPVGMEFLGREFTRPSARHRICGNRRPGFAGCPGPCRDSAWTYVVSDGTATFQIDPPHSFASAPANVRLSRRT